jgi:hypothetical protein
MDPWLERNWSSVHHRLINHFADQIQSQLPEGLFAEIEITVYITEDDDDLGNVIPDVSVLESDPLSGGQINSRAGTDAAVATPFRIKLPPEPIEQGHVSIRSLQDHQPLITVIEVLSPTNKMDHRGREKYLLKREEYYRARANVVEVDLLRGGAELVDVPFEEVPRRLITPYKAVVRPARPRDRIEAEYSAMPIREPLPRILIPLRRNDPEVVLDFQSAIDDAYARGRYGDRIDYRKPPAPALEPEDAAWAAALVAIT